MTIIPDQTTPQAGRPSDEALKLRALRIEVLGQLAGGIVHDINNILTAIIGNASLIEMGDPVQSPLLASNIIKSTKRGSDLLRQLQQFSKGTDDELRPINSNEVLVECIDALRETLGASWQIGYAAADALPTIQADPSQIHQILLCLTSNARDAMPQGGLISITARAISLTQEQASKLGSDARPGQFLEIAVQDSGPGIAPAARARLFEPFFTTKPKGKGFGLGLALVQRLVSRHGGTVFAASDVAEGARFTCLFPVLPG